MKKHTIAILGLKGARTMRAMGIHLAALALFSALAACATDVELIDRTQASKVDKAIFDPAGEWFFRATVVGNQYNQGFLFEGLEGEMERIRWRIEKDRLIAYRSYEWLEGAEQGTGTTHFEGSPVAVFNIESHFDVQRGYNEATGEQNNVLEENTTDRPWYERKYMRVDWSQNLLDGAWWSLEDSVSILGSAPYYVQENEVDNPYRSEITADAINVVQNYLLQTDFYTCYYVFLDPYFCGSSEAQIKLSFLKVKPDDYETLYYPDVQILHEDDGKPLYTDCYTDGTCDKAYLPVFERFGYFRHEHIKYDQENAQWLRDGRIYIGHRWNIWRRSHDLVGNLIAPSERQPGSVTYYVNEDFPAVNDSDGDGLDDQIWLATQASREDVAVGRARRIGLVTDWDEAFRETVASVKRQNPAYRDLTWENVPQIFTIKPNSCNLKTAAAYATAHHHMDTLREFGITSIQKGNLERACALLEWASDGDFTWQKAGDLRYSFVHWVDTPQQAGPLGYGPSAADPVTGELISANANIYGAAVDELAAYAADIVAFMNGDLSVTDLTEGRNVRDFIEATRVRANRDLSKEKLEQFKARMQHAEGSFFPSQVKMKWDRDHKHLQLDKESMQVAKEMLMPTVQRAQVKMQRMEGSSIEKELLLTDEIKRAVLGPDRYQPGVPLSGADADFSALEWMTTDLQQKHQEAMVKLMSRSILMADWTDPGMVSLAAELDNMTWEEVYDFMRREIYLSVTAHEVGHTLGLRHNFQGSMDALNYGPEFWSDYQYNATTGEGRINKSAGADQHMYASIMDYDARFYADSFHGIGLYDKAAIKFGYGMLVEVFDADPALWYYNFLDLYDYTDIPKVFGDGLSCYSSGSCSNANVMAAFGDDSSPCVVDDTYYNDALAAEDAGDWATATQKWNAYDVAVEQCGRLQNSYLLDGLANARPNVDNIYKRRDLSFDELVLNMTNYYKYWNLGMDVDYELFDEVPYKYCPDDFAYYSWVECKPWDKGANTLEVTRDRFERYDAYYFFRNFKRDRADFNDWTYVNSYLSSLYDRFFSQWSNAFIYGLYGGSFIGYDKNGNELTLADFSLGSDWQAAGLEGFNFMTAILEQPEPGTYCYDPTDARNELTGQPTGYSGNGALTAFTGMKVRNAPIEPGSVVITTAKDLMGSSLVLTDDGNGNLAGDGSGTIDYGSGVLSLSFSSVPAAGSISADFITKVFRPGCSTGTVVDVPLGVGKYYSTNWTDEYFYKATRIGSYYDKYAALFAMTDNEGFFFRDYASYFDVGAFALSYWSGGLKDEVLDVFTGAFTGGTGSYAWRYNAAGTGAAKFLQAPVVDIYDQGSSREALMALPRIESTSSYSLRWYGVVMPMLRYNGMFDYTEDFSNYTKICLDGYVDCMTYDPTVGTTNYTDPLTHYTYVASNTDRPEFAIGANLLKEAQAYVDEVYTPARQAFDAAGAACANDGLCPQRVALVEAERQINERTSFLDTLRDVGAVVDW